MVVTMKLAEVAPAGTVTLAGILAAALLPERLIRAPPAGATAFNVTLAFAVWHGLFKTDEPRMRAVSVGGCTVNAAVRVLPP
jgi:hypothetical protein